MRCLLLFGMIIFLAACTGGEASKTREVEMYNGDGDKVGTATLGEMPDGVQIKLKIEGLSPGLHGIHVHEFATCEGPDFKSAGSHLNPEGNEHGLMHPKGAHLGDLPNIEADSAGLVDTELMIAGATLKDGKNSILRGEGTSLVVHDSQDDGVSQPAGNSGERVICGEIKSDPNADSNSDEEKPSDPTDTNEEE